MGVDHLIANGITVGEITLATEPPALYRRPGLAISEIDANRDQAVGVEQLLPIGAVDALKGRLAARAWRRNVGAVDGFDGSWQDLDKRSLEAKIEAAIELAREPEPRTAYVPTTRRSA